MPDSVPLLLALGLAGAALLLGALVAGLSLRMRYRDRIVELQTLLQQEQSRAQEKLVVLTQAREEMRAQFRVLASDVLDEKTRRFTETSRQGLGDILSPLQEKISRFEKKVDETYNREARERFSLEKEIKNLQVLNARISEDAINLTRALKGESKTQGAWGEFILSSILEASGLVEGQQYETQRSLDAAGDDHSANGNVRRSQPDVLVYLPDNRQVIVDAKVSLTAYERYCSAENADDQAEYLRQHVLSLKTHIRQLSDKQYQHLPQVNSLDFVLLFVPIEPAFSQALQHEPQLFNIAFERNIVLVGPSTLLATLRTIHNIWRYEQQSRNAQDIARRAGALYDKFVSFVADMDDLGRKLDAGQRSYDAAMNKLQSGKGNLISRTERLKTLGARATKQQNAERLERALENDTGDDENDEHAQ
ncbi:DNA recombination protein RmuC [Pseudohongiella sp.]|uniref:DNA recombination protein RmuC n=1 Tax=marine sediment metagenome TaxID=412755 RepID=A0A0F9Z3C2_9ZZZZ|nr:DNA recombination protein RmuC [Pseudohongiella sp.]HDZ09106.1 DNA recombination protein RmuC [Pseudohongiella sp.]HEA63558.1 DNA recombination protein RmuC [Pseudohongiella sp.]